jgi:hypothetical protein
MVHLEELVVRYMQELKNDATRERGKRDLLSRARTEVHETTWLIFTTTTVGPYVNRAAHRLVALLQQPEWECRYAALECLGALRPETLVQPGPNGGKPVWMAVNDLAQKDPDVSIDPMIRR